MHENKTIPANGSDEATRSDRLDSWKEIAKYLQRDVRTVQRWEGRDGLPVHRLPHESQGTVFAYRSEIDRWRSSREHNHATSQGLSTNGGRRLFHRPWFVIVTTVSAILMMVLASQVLRRKPGSPSVPIPRQLTANANEDRVLSVAISPDGKYLAYSDESGILLKHIDTGEVQSLLSTKGLFVQNWFPDGSRVLASRYADPSLWIVSVLKGTAHKIQDDAAAGSVSPDGSHIVFWRNSATELWLMGTSGENPKKLVTAQPSELFADFCWSSNGQRFAYMKAHRGSEADSVTIESRDLNGEDSTEILSDPRLIAGGATGLAWLPDGRLMYALQNSTSNQLENNIWAIRTDTRTGKPIGEPRQVTALSGYLLLYFSFSADGKRLAFLQGREQFGIHVAKIEQNGRLLVQTRRLTLDKWNNIPSAWTSDSQAVLFESNRNGHAQIFKQGVDQTSPEAMLVGEDNHHRPSITPDHASLLFWVAPSGMDVRSTRLVRTNMSGGPIVEVLTTSGFASHSCAILPPNPCVVGEQIENQLVFSVFDPARGRGDELTRVNINEPSVNWSLSPDGTRVAVGDKMRIRIVDLKTGIARDFVPTIKLVDLQSIAWTADGKGMFVSVSPEIRAVLFYADLGGHARELIQYDGWIGNLVPSPDGAYLAFAKTTQEINAAMIENF